MQEQPTPFVERVIRGRYIIEGQLGGSNTGAAYLVRDQRSGARGAPGNLFVLKEVVEPNKQARRQLISEGKRLRRLNHPGLARVYRVLKEDKHNRVFLLTAYFAGQNLETLRQRQPGQRFSWSHAMSIMAPIVEAVISLHRQRPPIVHGDIKPANIIVGREDGRAVLVGLGMVKAGDAAPLRDADCSCYRAPEQYGVSIDIRADVYALGATFYTLATGKLPPAARSRTAGAVDSLEPLNSAAPAVPLHTAHAIKRAMSLDAGLRFSSVEQFWDALWLVEEHTAPVPDLPAVQEDPEPTIPLPRLPKREPVADRVEEPEDPDATVRLPPLPPGVHRPGRAAEQQ